MKKISMKNSITNSSILKGPLYPVLQLQDPVYACSRKRILSGRRLPGRRGVCGPCKGAAPYQEFPELSEVLFLREPETPVQVLLCFRRVMPEQVS